MRIYLRTMIVQLMIIVGWLMLPLLLQYEEMYNRSVLDPNGFWSDIAKEFYWEKQVQLPSRQVQMQQ